MAETENTSKAAARIVATCEFLVSMKISYAKLQIMLMKLVTDEKLVWRLCYMTFCKYCGGDFLVDLDRAVFIFC